MRLPASAKTANLVLQSPTLESSAPARLSQLKRELVLSLYFQSGPFWEAVQEVRIKWNVQPQQALPSEDDRNSTKPLEQLPRRFQNTRLEVIDDRGWGEDLQSLGAGFVPSVLARSGWEDFLGACVMCNPPDNRLSEFADFGRVFPAVFWPVVNSDERDPSELPRMIAPPIERVWKRGSDASYEDNEQFMEYRIIVDEHTTEDEVKSAFRAIKTAYGYRKRGGKPPIDKLTAIQCAILYDDHNGTDPYDKRFRLWTYTKIAAKFELKNKRSAEEHVKRGRELRENFRNT